jgi:hypothetical protein
MDKVYLLWHVHQVGDDEDSKLLGVYSTEQLAVQRIERSRTKPGFAAHPDGFVISPYELDQDTWTEGFVTG